MMGLYMDVAAILGSMLGGSWAAGMVMHFERCRHLSGDPYIVLYMHLPGFPAATGTMWGAVLWLLVQTMVMPVMSGGFFSAAIGGMMAAGGSLIGHVIYGSLLGVIASTPEPRVASA
jgi:hypothetical protein